MKNKDILLELPEVFGQITMAEKFQPISQELKRVPKLVWAMARTGLLLWQLDY